MKFTEKTIKEFIQKYQNGQSIRSIAIEYNTTTHTVSKYMKQYGCIIESQHAKRFNENAFDIIDTPDKAYWLGFLYTDGNIGSSDNSITINLQESDIEHLRKFNKFLDYAKDNIKVYSNKEGFKFCRFYCKNAHMHEQLNKLGCVPNKSLIIKFPEFMINSQYIWDFIRGIFDGDGCVTFDNRGNNYSQPRCSISSGSEEFIYKLSEVIKDLGFGNIVHKRGNIYILSIGDKTYGLNAKFLVKLYENSSVYLTRKYEHYLNYKRGRSVQEYTELLSGNIGEKLELESRDQMYENPEINSEIKESESSYSVEGETYANTNI